MAICRVDCDGNWGINNLRTWFDQIFIVKLEYLDYAIFLLCNSEARELEESSQIIFQGTLEELNEGSISDELFSPTSDTSRPSSAMSVPPSSKKRKTNKSDTADDLLQKAAQALNGCQNVEVDHFETFGL
ncbi:hypothetical protein NQ317_018103 [Molorchus minor]|uniref:Uncharacterized protein n=1 Tax=Molorchus minor TaxID=1323400 RepID=A0ABQ9IY12_9CUCU|nr:hypothetical protein NQ317_018103 [Molorchus minor]